MDNKFTPFVLLLIAFVAMGVLLLWNYICTGSPFSMEEFPDAVSAIAATLAVVCFLAAGIISYLQWEEFGEE